RPVFSGERSSAIQLVFGTRGREMFQARLAVHGQTSAWTPLLSEQNKQIQVTMPRGDAIPTWLSGVPLGLMESNTGAMQISGLDEWSLPVAADGVEDPRIKVTIVGQKLVIQLPDPFPCSLPESRWLCHWWFDGIRADHGIEVTQRAG